MDNNLQWQRATHIHQCKARERRESQIFTLSWRGGGALQIVGYAALARYLRLKEASLPVLFSRGGGASFELARPNPLHGETDVCTVVRQLQKKTIKKRGRPAKHGPHSTDPRLGIELAGDASAVPKETNRRRREKSKLPQ